jgi:tripartite-type tricarboxylate transporter receptor subunit TctC
MTDMKRILAALVLPCVLAGQALAQGDPAANYPDKPIKIIVTVPAGGGVDTVTRIYAEKLRQRWGQTVVVENRGGAAGNLGAEAASTAPADGYTLMASQPSPITTNKFLYKKLNFDPDALIPVAIMSQIPNVLLVRSEFPAKTAQEFLAYAKANPGKLNYASQGTGTTSHLTTELFEARTGTKLQHVPYKGTAPALNDLVGTQVDFIFMELAAAIELHRGKKARILAVATKQRLPELPDIPTMEEAGVKDFISGTWNAISAPPKTPAAIVKKINAAINEIAQSPEVKAHFAKVHLSPVPGDPAQAAAFVKTETKLWGEVIKAAGVQPE